MKKTRYIIQLDGKDVGRATSISNIGEVLGCSKQHVHKAITNGTLKLKHKVYTIIDRLDHQ